MSDNSPLQITTTTLPDGNVGVPYSQLLAATGGSTPYTWDVDRALPDGLTLSGDQITGKPTTAQTLTFRVRVTDSLKSSDFKDLNLKINDSTVTGQQPVSPPVLQITTTTLPDGNV